MSNQSSVTPPGLGGSRTRSTAPFLLFVGLVGALSGVFAAYSYYQDLLGPFAHALSPWLLLAAVVSARQRPRDAALRTVSGLVGAVVAFYVGKPVFYGIYHPEVPAIGVAMNDLVLWCVLAVFAGTVLGLVFSEIGGSAWPGAAATAAAVALILVATFGEVGPTLSTVELPLTAFSVCAVVVVLALADRTATQLKRTSALILPLALVSLALVAAPDLIERIIFVGL